METPRLHRTESTVRSQLRRAYQLIRRKVFGGFARKPGAKMGKLVSA